MSLLQESACHPSQVSSSTRLDDMCDGGGTIKRGRERLTLRKDGPLWTTVLGTVEPLILAARIGGKGESTLEAEHQRLGHIGRERLL